MAAEWGSVAEGYRLHLSKQALSVESADSYVAYTRLAWQWLAVREVDLVTADDLALSQFIESYRRDHKRNTVRNAVCALRSFYKFCIDKGWRSDNPAMQFSIRKPKQLPKKPFSPDELRALFAAATSVLDKTLLTTLLATALRIGEAVRLDIPDIDLTRRLALLHGKGDKERWVKLYPDAACALREYIGDRKAGPVFINEHGERLTRSRAWKRLLAVGARAGVVNVYPHRFRTTFANMFLTQGGDLGALKEIMGHEDIKTTERYAAFSQAQRALDQMDRFNPLGLLALPVAAPV